MTPRTLVTFAIAILLGLLAVLMVRNYVAPKGSAAMAKSGAGAAIVVAVQPIERGAKLTPGMLKVVRVPSDAAPAGAFSAVDAVTGVDRVALRAIAINEAVLPASVSGPGGRAILSSSVTDGMRAVSLRSNDVAGVAGFVLPGDHVDVLLTRDTGKGDGSVATQLLADNILVLGVDQSNDDGTDKPQVAKAVTVQVTPDQAQAIALAQQLGSVSLALRSVADSGAPMKKSTTVADLAIGGPRPTAAARPAPVRARTAPAKPAAASPNQTVHVTRGVETAGYEIAAR